LSVSALLLTFAVPARSVFRLQGVFTAKSIDYVCRIILICSLVVGYAYGMEVFMACYSASKYEGDAFLLRTLYGPSAWYYWVMVFCNVLVPQLFWFKGVRRKLWAAWAVCIAVDLGMLCERYGVSVTTWR
jgi:molybdopterin-containing oxidoreductase family membrane subunit